MSQPKSKEVTFVAVAMVVSHEVAHYGQPKVKKTINVLAIDRKDARAKIKEKLKAIYTAHKFKILTITKA